MDILVELKVNLETGVYDVRFKNLSRPGEDIDIQRLAAVVSRVLENVAMKTTEMGQASPTVKLSVN